ncbi:MAG: response regulator [Bacteroidota bacterium]|nr:response regulator [Bacteroidota bacterium]
MSDIKNKYKILLVEDNKLNQMIISNKLKSYKHEIDIANNGEEGVIMHAKKYYDFILMDIMMPVMDGYVATKNIRNSENNSDIPIIAVTANVLDHDQKRCLDAGMNAYLSKPFDFNELKTILASLSFNI